MPKFLKRINRELKYEPIDEVDSDYTLIFTKPNGSKGVIENLTAEEIVSAELRKEGCKYLQARNY